MKKLLLISCCMLLGFTYSQAQIIVYCESPASVAGNKAFTYTDQAGGWGTKDMTLPANSVKDTLMLVDDGTTGDSLGCSPLIVDLTGKIAIVYRGSCEFGVKVKNAQDQGAVACIVINNVAGAPVGMGPGAQGANDTIPSVMISNTDGAALVGAMQSGPVVVFIGNKKGLYNNDLGCYAIDLLVPRVTANPKLISANATEFNVPMGGWVHNYGINAQTNVSLRAVISGAATYTGTSTAIASLAPGDSAYCVIPTYSAATYSGMYEVNYSIVYGNTDDFNADNTFYGNFLIDSLLSYALLDVPTQMPKANVHVKVNSTPPPAEYRTCIHFRDPNASRLSALGLYTSATTTFTISLPGEGLDALAYEWNDAFTGLSDPAFPAATTPWTLVQVGQGQYTYTADLQGKNVYIPFASPVHLKDNQRYLFCSRTFNPDINLGFDAHFNYLEVIDSTGGTGGHDQPISCVITDTENYGTGFGTDMTSAVSVLMGDQFASVNENNKSFDVTPYPNPTTESIKIPLKGMTGTAELNIMDVNGKVVNTQSVKVAGEVTVNVKGVSAGNYVFKMSFEDGRNTSFKVVITK